MTSGNAVLNENDKRSAIAQFLVLGIGNVLLTDEGVGVETIKEMKSIPLPPFVELFDGGTSGADLLDVIACRKKIVVIDAMDSDLKAGEIAVFSEKDFSACCGVQSSLHDIGIIETLGMAKLLGCEPEHVTVIGIQPEVVAPGTALSKSVKKAIPRVIIRILKEIEEYVSVEVETRR